MSKKQEQAEMDLLIHREAAIVIAQSEKRLRARELADQGAVGTARILLAEDNKVNQMVAMKILTRYGYHVDAVENGSECVEALRRSSYDLVLMDCHMPGMDGYEATEIIRSSEGRPFQNVPILAMTANALVGDRERCLAAGMTDYLTKPIKAQTLTAAVEKVLMDTGVRPKTATSL